MDSPLSSSPGAELGQQAGGLLASAAWVTFFLLYRFLFWAHTKQMILSRERCRLFLVYHSHLGEMKNRPWRPFWQTFQSLKGMLFKKKKIGSFLVYGTQKWFSSGACVGHGRASGILFSKFKARVCFHVYINSKDGVREAKMESEQDVMPKRVHVWTTGIRIKTPLVSFPPTDHKFTSEMVYRVFSGHYFFSLKPISLAIPKS